jgi:hypothetical protein
MPQQERSQLATSGAVVDRSVQDPDVTAPPSDEQLVVSQRRFGSHYPTFPWANRAIGPVAAVRQPEHRHDVAAAVHADLLHQRLDQARAHRQRPVPDRRAHRLQQLGQRLRVRRRIMRGVQQVAQLVLAGLELDQLGGERLDAPAALLLSQGAGFEGVQVAVDRGFGLADLATDRAQLSLVLLAQVRGLAAGGARQRAVAVAGVAGVVGDSDRAARPRRPLATRSAPGSSSAHAPSNATCTRSSPARHQLAQPARPLLSSHPGAAEPVGPGSRWPDPSSSTRYQPAGSVLRRGAGTSPRCPDVARRVSRGARTRDPTGIPQMRWPACGGSFPHRQTEIEKEERASFGHLRWFRGSGYTWKATHDRQLRNSHTYRRSVCACARRGWP